MGQVARLGRPLTGTARSQPLDLGYGGLHRAQSVREPADWVSLFTAGLAGDARCKVVREGQIPDCADAGNVVRPCCLGLARRLWHSPFMGWFSRARPPDAFLHRLASA